MGDVIDFTDFKNEKAEKTFAHQWHLTTGVDLAKELPLENFLIEGLGITAPGVMIMGGAGFGGKTMFAQHLALCIASGRKLLGHYPVRQGRVVHLDWEQGKLTTRRYQRLAREMSIDLTELGDALTVSILPTAYLSDDRAEEDMLQLCDGAAVCIIDAFRGAFPKAQENDSGVRMYLDMLRHVSDATGCAMIVIAHSRKMSDDKDVRSSLRGSGALFDAADTVYMLDGQGKGKPTQVHNTKDRILGETRETFGIRIEDTDDGTNPRWGLNVSYVSPQDLQAQEILDRDDQDRKDAMTADSLASVSRRVMMKICGPDGPGTPHSLLAVMGQARNKDLACALDVMTRDGIVRVEGTGNNRTFWLTGRQPGED